MRRLFLLIFTVSCAIHSLSQQKNVDNKTELLETLTKKQIICDDLEKQIKDIPFAAVRVVTGYKIAFWLWKDGKDDSGRAEQIAVNAIDDLYENKTDIPDFYFSVIRSELLTLLDRNARDRANELREKHKINLEDESDRFDSLLNQKEGEKLAVDAAVKSLINQSETNSDLIFLIAHLQQRHSPEFLRLLNAIVQAEEVGRTRFTADTLFLMSGYFVKSNYFVESNVPIHLQKRFLKVVIDKSRNAAQMPDGDIEGFFNLLNGVMSEISTKFQELFPEASIIQIVLKTKTSKEVREVQERADRIKNSADKLSALIAEAERTDNNPVKYDLYVNAAHLALKQKKFIYAIDIVEKTVEINISNTITSNTFRNQWRDQFRGQVVTDALQSGDPDSAAYAMKKMTQPYDKAESLRKTANYYADRNNLESARYALDESIKNAVKAENTGLPILIKLLPVAQKIDPSLVFDVNRITAKSINAIPSLNLEDKPQTENYKNYVAKVMAVNWNLLPALTQMVKVNKNAAMDLASRIDKKEIKIIADYVLLTDSIDQIQKKIEKKQLN